MAGSSASLLRPLQVLVQERIRAPAVDRVGTDKPCDLSPVAQMQAGAVQVPHFEATSGRFVAGSPTHGNGSRLEYRLQAVRSACSPDFTLRCLAGFWDHTTDSIPQVTSRYIPHSVADVCSRRPMDSRSAGGAMHARRRHPAPPTDRSDES